MFKSILRFVGIIAFMGALAPTNSWAVSCSQYAGHTCPSGKYWHIINQQCQTCSSDAHADCSSGVFKCVSDPSGNPKYAPYLSTANNGTGDYYCRAFYWSGSMYTSWSTCGEGLSQSECYAWRYFDATGCRAPEGSGYRNNVVAKKTTFQQNNSGEMIDPCTGKYYYNANHSNPETSYYTFEALPGYYKSGSSACTQCSAGTFSPGGSEATSCISCPKVISGEEQVGGGNVVSQSVTSPAGASSPTQCYYTAGSSSTGSDETGTYTFSGATCSFTGSFDGAYGICIAGMGCAEAVRVNYCKGVLGVATDQGQDYGCQASILGTIGSQSTSFSDGVNCARWANMYYLTAGGLSSVFTNVDEFGSAVGSSCIIWLSYQYYFD